MVMAEQQPGGWDEWQPGASRGCRTWPSHQQPHLTLSAGHFSRLLPCLLQQLLVPVLMTVMEA